MKSLITIFMCLSIIIVSCAKHAVNPTGCQTSCGSVSTWQAIGTLNRLNDLQINDMVLTNNGSLYIAGSRNVNLGALYATNAESASESSLWLLQPYSMTYPLKGSLARDYSNDISAVTVSTDNKVYSSLCNYLNLCSLILYFDKVDLISPVTLAYLPQLERILFLRTSPTNQIYAAGVGYDVGQNAYFSNVYQVVAGAWQPAGSGSLPVNQIINDFMITESGELFVALGDVNLTTGQVYKFNVTENKWKNYGPVKLPDNGAVTALAQIADLIYAATANGNVYQYQNAEWQLSCNRPVEPGIRITNLAKTEDSHILAATENGRIYACHNSVWQLLGGDAVPDQSAINKLIYYKRKVFVATQNNNVFQTPISW